MWQAISAVVAAVVAPLLGAAARASRRNRLAARVRALHGLADDIEAHDGGGGAEPYARDHDGDRDLPDGTYRNPVAIAFRARPGKRAVSVPVAEAVEVSVLVEIQTPEVHGSSERDSGQDDCERLPQRS